MSKSKRKTKSRSKNIVEDESDTRQKMAKPKTELELNSTSKYRTLEQQLTDLSLDSNTIELGSFQSETEIPKDILYYGWFFSEEANLTLKSLSTFYLAECLKVPQFERFLKTQCFVMDVKDVYDFYKTPRKKKASDKLKYHITAKFLDRQPLPEYQTIAQKYAEKAFRIHLNGLFFTSKTHGFRVRLTDAQKYLFDEREGQENEFLKAQKHTPPSREEMISVIDDELAKPLPKTKLSACSSKIHQLVTDTPVSTANLPICHPTALRSRAHVTIGCASRVKPIQSGRDLLDITDLETRMGSTSVFHKDFPIDGGTLRQFGKDPTAFVIYPCHELVAEATFMPFI